MGEWWLLSLPPTKTKGRQDGGVVAGKQTNKNKRCPLSRVVAALSCAAT